MPVDFYYFPASPPCRAVMLAARALGVELNPIMINWIAGEASTPEYLKMNIQHSVPTLDDDGFYINESRAMIQYLANKYGKDDTLYPQDPQERAKVDMRLNFDNGTLFARFADSYLPTLFSGAPLNQGKIEKLDEALEFLEVYLEEGYAAGSTLTIADFSVIASLTTIGAVEHDFSNYPNVQAYMEKMKAEMDGYEELNQVGVDMFNGMTKDVMAKARADLLA